MRKRCCKCGDEKGLVVEVSHIQYALPELDLPPEIVVFRTCTNCGYEDSRNIRYEATDQYVVSNGVLRQLTPESQCYSFEILDSRAYTCLNYHGGPIQFPAHEAKLAAGCAIDRYGEPDLMVRFAAEYLKKYRVIVPPKGSLLRIAEMMPALLLLVSAAELAMKAYLMRSDKPSTSHALRTLYDSLELEHRREIENQFANISLNDDLKFIGAKCPTVESILDVYEKGDFGRSIYTETRYLAEPTTMLKSQDCRGSKLFKSIYYPIFLPFVVQTMIKTYVFFSGAERLKRLGADVSQGSQDPGRDQRGNWDLVPSSVGLVVICLAQLDRDVICRFKATRPFVHSWEYGEQTFLFYLVGKDHPKDGEAVIDGLECKVWYAERLAMYQRDLYLLANELEASGDLTKFQWTSAPSS